MNTDMSFQRQRSNTAHNLDKLKKARARASRIKSVKYDEKGAPLDDTEKESFLQRRAVDQYLLPGAGQRSKLSEALLVSPKQSQNKFIEYARFDGSAQAGVPTRTMQIFLTVLPESQRNYPMSVCVSMNAKVLDFIGLICYKCSLANPEVPLKTVRHYGLYITEEDGEVDPDFPPLDVREPCSKFRFSHLALVERTPPVVTLAPSATATLAPLSANPSGLPFDYPRTLSMTSEMESARHQALLTDEKTRRLNLQQQQSRDLATMNCHTTAIEAPLYRSYRVNMLVVSSFYKVEIQLGVSGEKIEIDPVQQKNNKFWSSKQRAVTHKITSIAAADLVDVKANRAIFRIIYMPEKGTGYGSLLSSSYEPVGMRRENIGGGGGGVSGSVGGMGSANAASIDLEYRLAAASLAAGKHHSQPPLSPTFKHHSFETDLKTAQEIVEKVKNILDVRSSATRKEFLTYQEKKSKRKNRPKTNI